MAIDRDRITLIKRIHMGLEKKPKPKKKRLYVPKAPRQKMSREERLVRRRECQRARVQKYADAGLCRKCGRDVVTLDYRLGDKVIMSLKTVFCVKHSKNKKLIESFNAIPVSA